LKIITSRRQSDIGFPGSAGSPEKRWPLAGYDARIAGFSYAEPRFKASGHWILRQDRGFSTRDEPLPSVSGTASRNLVPGKPAVRHRSRAERFRQCPTSVVGPLQIEREAQPLVLDMKVVLGSAEQVGIQQQADIDQDFLGIPPDHQGQMVRIDRLSASNRPDQREAFRGHNVEDEIPTLIGQPHSFPRKAAPLNNDAGGSCSATDLTTANNPQSRHHQVPPQPHIGKGCTSRPHEQAKVEPSSDCHAGKSARARKPGLLVRCRCCDLGH
jgi:hypothetical protein